MLFGQVVLLIGLTLAAEEPIDYLRDNWLDVPRFLLAGLVVAAFTTTLPLAVSAFTTRRAYAAAFVIGVFILSIPIAEILTECDEEQELRRRGQPCEPSTGEAGKWLALLHVPQVPMHVNDIIFDLEGEDRTKEIVGELPDVIPIAWYLLLIGGPGFALWWRYRKIKL